MARQRRPRLREHHRPGQAGSAKRPHSSPLMKLPMRPAARPGRHARRDQVGDLAGTTAAAVANNAHRDDHAEQAAVERHAALPDREDLERMRGVVAGLVEEHVAEPAADDDAEHAVEQQVLDVAPGPAAPAYCGRRARRAARNEEQARSRPGRSGRTSGSRSEPIFERSSATRVVLGMHEHAQMISRTALSARRRPGIATRSVESPLPSRRRDADQPPLQQHHRGRRARAEPLDVLRDGLRGRATSTSR